MKMLFRLVAVAAAALVVPLAGIATATSAGATPPNITISVLPYTKANPLVEVGGSVINAVVQVEALVGFAGEPVNITSTDLEDTCASFEFLSVSGAIPPTASTEGSPTITVDLDNDGNATVDAYGIGCTPRTDKIYADLAADPPYSTAHTKLHVVGPQNTPAGLTARPSTEVETGASGDVSTVFYFETKSVYNEKTVEINANELVDRCAFSEWINDQGVVSPENSTTATAILDDNGNATFTFFGTSCAKGLSHVSAVVESGLDPHASGTFKIQSNRPTDT